MGDKWLILVMLKRRWYVGPGVVGSYLVRCSKKVRGGDRKFPEFSDAEADDFAVGDLRRQDFCRLVIDRRFHEVYRLAADMGGAEFISRARTMLT